MKLNVRSIVKAAVYMAVGAGFFVMAAYADTSTTPPANSLGDVAGTVTSSFANLAKIISAISYIAGFAFSIAGVFKLKQHKDNPQQIAVTIGITLIALGIGLIFMPSIFQMGGATLFGTNAQTAGVTGITTFTGGNIAPGNN